MNSRPIPAVANDFADVWGHLTSLRVLPNPQPPQMAQIAKKIHFCTYSLSLWKFRLKPHVSHASPFLEEIASDAIQILPQIMMGFRKPARLLARGVLENLLRYLYFVDHPIEFARMNAEGKWYLTIKELFEYAKVHPVFQRAEKEFDAINRAQTLYDELSSVIHGRRVSDLEMRAALQKIVYSTAMASQEVNLIRRCAEATNFLLAVQHRNKMQSFPLRDRQIILHTLPKPARQVWLTFQEE